MIPARSSQLDPSRKECNPCTVNLYLAVNYSVYAQYNRTRKLGQLNPFGGCLFIKSNRRFAEPRGSNAPRCSAWRCVNRVIIHRAFLPKSVREVSISSIFSTVLEIPRPCCRASGNLSSSELPAILLARRRTVIRIHNTLPGRLRAESVVHTCGRKSANDSATLAATTDSDWSHSVRNQKSPMAHGIEWLATYSSG